MALFSSSYVAPGVYTEVALNATTAPLFGNLRIPVLIGEGQETFTFSNIELFRGSSSVADNQVVSEDLSAQITAPTRTLQLTYFPLVTGAGTGNTNVGPTDVQVVDNGIPVTILSVNGATGVATAQTLFEPGDSIQATYYFKKRDTLVSKEDDSDQVPSYATALVTDGGSDTMLVTLSLPGDEGNLISLMLVDGAFQSPPTTAPDALAVSGAGTDSIQIQLRNTDNSLRTLAQVAKLINAGIPTLDSGYLVVSTTTGSQNNPCEDSEFQFTGGAGPQSNTVFQVQNVPIVDGSNGGVVTTNPSNVTVTVNGAPVAVTAVDGANGMITLAKAVPAAAELLITYFFNHYQDTWDLLPGPGQVASLSLVGLGPNRADFTQGIDYTLGTDANSGLSIINWGNAALISAGAAASGSGGISTFTATVINTTLYDNKAYLQAASGTVNGKNATFKLSESPTDGSGLGLATNNPALISVYAGTDPVNALLNGPLQVITLSGASGQFTLFNPPAAGLKVYATFWYNQINNHVFTLAVVNPQINVGGGTYSIVDDESRPVPTVVLGANSVTQQSNFDETGIVWPNGNSDLETGLGGIAETITVTFQADDDSVITPALQASGRLPAASGIQPSSWLVFQNTTPGSAGNAVTVTFVSGTPTPAATAVSATTNAVTVQVTDQNGSPRSLGAIAALFAGGILTPGGQINSLGQVFTTAGGIMIVTLKGAAATLAPASVSVTLSGGTDAVYESKAVEFVVTSSAGVLGTQGTGYLGQTFESAVTGVKFTIVDPASALDYGYTSLPDPQYQFEPGDTLQFIVSLTTPYATGLVPTINVPGIKLAVTSTYGMNTGDTAIVTTFKGSGNEPSVGEYYYVTYETTKTAQDMALQIFTKASDAYAAYGQPSTINRLSLGVSLLTQNGAQTFACIQVPKQPGLGIASDADFVAAIQSLAVPLPGTQQKANVIVPLSTSSTVQQALNRFTTTNSGVRQKGECIGFIGPNQLATPAEISALAQSIANQRIILVGNPVAGVEVNVGGDFVEYAVSGEFIAAALAGLNTNPVNDVATSLLNQNVIGFSRLLVTYDGPTLDLMSSAGVTPLVENNGALLVRDYLTTNPANILTSEPTVTTITDYTTQTFRAGLNQFIGRKFLPTLVTSVQATCNSILQSLVADEIINGYTQPVVEADKTDPTLMDVTINFQPMFTLKYIQIEFAVDTLL